MEATRVVDNLFELVKTKCTRAIAFSNDEKVRMELLHLLEKVTALEVKIHQELNTKSIDKVLITTSNGDDLPEEIISELGPVTEFIESK